MSNKSLKTIGIIAGLVVLITAGFFISHSFQKSTAPSGVSSGAASGSTSTGSLSNSYSFPQTLQGLNLTQSISGPRAIAMIGKLHGSNIQIKQGYIAQYEGASGQIMVWVSESNDTAEARQLFDIMDQRITSAAQNAGSAGNAPPFTNRRAIGRNGVSIIAVKGMGMENYYYQVGSRVYWLAVGGVDPLKTLDEFMKTKT